MKSKGAYFFYEDETKGPRILLFIYMKKPNTKKYSMAMLDNYVDYPAEVDAKDIKKMLEGIPTRTPLYNVEDYTPEELHDEMKSKNKKISKFYSKNWFTKQYQFIHHQFSLVEK